MKRSLLFALMPLVLLFSCGKDLDDLDYDRTDQNEVPEEGFKGLPIEITLSTGGQESILEFFYIEGTNQLEKIVEGEREESFYYENGLISSLNSTDGSYQELKYDEQGRLVSSSEYEHETLVSVLSLTYESDFKAVLNIKEYGEEVMETNIHLTFSEQGNLLTLENPEEFVLQSDYAESFSPLFRIAGFKEYHIGVTPIMGEDVDILDVTGRVNNPIESIITSDGIGYKTEYSYEFENAQYPDLPTRITGLMNGSDFFEATITYN